MTQQPWYFEELRAFVEASTDEPIAVLAALSALLSDSSSYAAAAKFEPAGALQDFVQELILTFRPLGTYLKDPDTPVGRVLIDGKWCAVWRGARGSSQRRTSFEYDVCISFAGSDRAIAEKIANGLAENEMNHRIFYDDFEKSTLFGEDLVARLQEIYLDKSAFCVILFSHAYRDRAWTRHELRAAQTRVLQERTTYVLPVEIDKGAIPTEFSHVGYWSFQSGDEPKIVEAIERKISAHISQHFYTLEEMAKVLSRDNLILALLDGFRAGVAKLAAAGENERVPTLWILALIATLDAESLDRSVRALIDLVLFEPGPIDEFFVDDRAQVFDLAHVRRRLGTHGPLLFSSEGWADFIERYRWPDDDDEDDTSKE